ncbi:hypothetical protein L1987_69109 [Smallanthus sonchifolius]|uniref:Uncharacterized protein n=1 Tax=Smallanthus sonchifolius TaxID=185202 RepID=A0ACB9B5J2_9ASTR|nr:hypothetical protein L1987_69109 [Smallanthus sonchifolius]
MYVWRTVKVSMTAGVAALWSTEVVVSGATSSAGMVVTCVMGADVKRNGKPVELGVRQRARGGAVGRRQDSEGRPDRSDVGDGCESRRGGTIAACGGGGHSVGCIGFADEEEDGDAWW